MRGGLALALLAMASLAAAEEAAEEPEAPTLPPMMGWHRFVAVHRDEVLSCLAADHEGELLLRVTLDERSHASRVEVEGASGAAGCIAAKARAWDFSPLDGGIGRAAGVERTLTLPFARFPPGRSVSARRVVAVEHPFGTHAWDFDELVIVLGGALELDGARNVRVLGVGDAVFFGRGQTYGYRPKEPATAVLQVLFAHGDPPPFDSPSPFATFSWAGEFYVVDHAPKPSGHAGPLPYFAWTKPGALPFVLRRVRVRGGVLPSAGPAREQLIYVLAGHGRLAAVDGALEPGALKWVPAGVRRLDGEATLDLLQLVPTPQ